MTKRLCTILARGGSKGLKSKNVKELLGKPLIAHSITQAKSSGLFEAVAVSSDSGAILDIARRWEADYLIERPAELATDEAPKIPAVQHCVKETEQRSGRVYDVIVDLDPTSPLRLVSDIEAAVQLLESQRVSNVITAAPARHSPYFNLIELDERGVARLSKPMPQQALRRQDAPPCYDINASVYVWQRDALFRKNWIFFDDTLLYVMPRERSIDIDSELDFEFVEYLMRKRLGDLVHKSD